MTLTPEENRVPLLNPEIGLTVEELVEIYDNPVDDHTWGVIKVAHAVWNKALIKEIVQRMELVERELAGNIELAYWRGKQEHGVNEEAIREELIKWGEEDCPHAFLPKQTELDDGDRWKRRECSECWQALKQVDSGQGE